MRFQLADLVFVSGREGRTVGLDNPIQKLIAFVFYAIEIAAHDGDLRLRILHPPVPEDAHRLEQHGEQGRGGS
ncbi:hypothetical protein [uncultured Roseibium sp.]|uniref:hypothetical protein n=1 Tax=uncultured Roseibium sp. TaxID=1936171 RepID=UPI0032179052